MLINESWQPVPGTRGTEIYPFIIKPNSHSSNAYLLATDDYIILIDTGTSPEQMERIKTVIRPLMADQERPLLIFLTHCHADHCLLAFSDWELGGIAKVRVAIQEYGAKALEEKDARRTLADILRKELPDARIDLPLLTGQDREKPGKKVVNLGEGIILSTRVEKIDPGDKSDFFKQVIKIGPETSMEIYPMPGHSPDGIALRIGEIVFTGDFFMAVNFLVAGVVGWKQDDMMNSIHHMRWLAENSAISCFCTGHGDPLSRQSAMDNMSKMRTRTAGLTDLSELNWEHMTESSGYALELLEELNDTMAVIAGRLYYLVYYLDYLGESDKSEKVGAALDFDRINDLLDEYSDFAQLFEAGNMASPILILKAAHLTGKIEKIFTQGGTDLMIDRYLFRRVQRSFADFMQICGGMPIHDAREVLDMNQLLQDLLRDINRVPYNDDILEVLDREEQFIDALVLRIAFQPIIKGVTFHFLPDPDLLRVRIDQERFCDALLGILEEIAAIDVKEICIVSGNTDTGPAIRISNPKGIPENVFTKKKLGLYERKFASLGGLLKIEQDQSGIRFVIELST
ncbi:MBL fold metallo-hydrolase [Candidatus Formimonas warabiya]|uniref:Metallo-beta-lactamase domain-containing protein n=1 Tax=Formimonas warabiya TaxID=1761012 RepID=A0A3G1KS73_FORW1|nr:MBL fold metallo-hydrolase [Candidatus Formimonas warabiya]ATW25244.1 hypothetical protein DCMF_11115 [Candidatus Formimonas warabiya]